MTAQKYNARDCQFEIEDPGAPGSWQPIAGIDTFTKGHSDARADTTTFASGGDAEEQVMQRGKTLKLAGFRLKDPDTGVLDPGQSLVEALGDQKSDASLGTIRFAHNADVQWEVWTATCALDDSGGGNNDKTSWGVTFTRSGASTTAIKS